MSDRITKTDIEEKMRLLTERTGREYQLERWSPGDGWSRNQLLMKNEETDSLTNITNPMKTREMYQFIRGYLDISRALETRDDVEEPPYMWRYREDDDYGYIDFLMPTEPTEDFSGDGEVSIITWR